MSRPSPFSSIRYYAGCMPVGILTNDDGKVVGYLSPDCGYAFRVSYDFKGHRDCSSTKVFGLNNLLDARLGTKRDLGNRSDLRMESVKLYLLELAAKEAIDQFCKNTWMLTAEYGCEIVRVFHDTKCQSYLWYNEYDPNNGEALPHRIEATMLQRFTALCAKWLAPDLYDSWIVRINVVKDVQAIIDRHKTEAAEKPSDADYHNQRIEEIRKDFAELVNMMNSRSPAR